MLPRTRIVLTVFLPSLFVAQVTNFWGGAQYPLVPGHEVIGTVTQIGSGVKNLKVGDRVGVSPQADSCAACDHCSTGKEQLCKQLRFNYGSPTRDPGIQAHSYGGFAEFTRVKESWAFPIPDRLNPLDAAPLLCAGITVWNPIVEHKIKAGDKVGVVGIGGLGHLALQFLNKLGCEVTAITRTPDKAEEARKFGAQHVLVTGDPEQVKAARGSLDFILSTLSSNEADWDLYFSLLAPEGKLVLVGLPTKVTFNPMGLVFGQLSFSGSFLCGSQDIQNMLEFSAKHGITAQTEVLPMTAANADLAMQKLERNEPRYRMVLVNTEHPNNKSDEIQGRL